MILIVFVLYSAILFYIWSREFHEEAKVGLPEDFPSDFSMKFLMNMWNKQDPLQVEGAPEVKKFYFKIFLGLIIIVSWCRFYTTISNTMLAGPTLRILSAMVG